jgi:uncharacterized protein (TIGR03032 family)
LKNFSRHSAEWRDPAQVVSHWQAAGEADPRLFRHRSDGRWWETLAALRVTLVVSRETEHVVMALRSTGGEADVSYFRIPHPSGIAVDHDRTIVHVASTRNPNQVFDFEPARLQSGRPELGRLIRDERHLLPVRTRILPGSLYLHDLAMLRGRLHGAAVGQNAIVELPMAGGYRRTWWPAAIETADGPVFRQNHLQLNGIAAGTSLSRSFFSASAARMSPRRPGHLNFPVDRRGVILSGATREPVVRGLTRPHSVRLHDGRVWVDDSGYGTVGPCSDGRYEVAARLPGWTRGLAFAGKIAFVGTSRVIPRFYRYAPGLELKSSVCGVHALDVRSGAVVGSLTWPEGNQIFGIETINNEVVDGFPFRPGIRSTRRHRDLFYSFASTRTDGGLDATL